MPYWETYRLAADPTSRERRDHGISREDLPSEFDLDYYEEEVRPELLDLQSRGFNIGIKGFTAEGMWLRAGKPTFFLESAQLAEALMKASYSLDFDNLRVPNGIFSLSFPSDVKVGKDYPHPCLIAQTPERDALLIVTRCGYFQHHILQIFNQKDLDAFLKEKDAMCVGYLDKDGIEQWKDSDECTPEEVRELSGLSVEEMQKRSKTQQFASKVCVGVCAYLAAFPECLEEGYPSIIAPRNLKQIKQLQKGVKPSRIVLHKRLRESPSAHYRTWYFKTLRDPCFRRNPDGTFRTIFVKETFVSGRAKKEKIDPHTVVEKKRKAS